MIKPLIKLKSSEDIQSIIVKCRSVSHFRSRSEKHQDFSRTYAIQNVQARSEYSSVKSVQLDQPKGRYSQPGTKGSESASLSKDYWYKQYRSKDKFCGDITLSRNTRPVFKELIKKYKRHFHPANASHGQNDTTKQNREPKQSIKFRESLGSQDSAVEIRRLTILSKVISENNRRERRLMKLHNINRQKTLY